MTQQGHMILILVTYLWYRNMCPSVSRGTRKHSTRRTHRGTRLTQKERPMTQETCYIHLYGFLSVRPIINAYFLVSTQDIEMNFGNMVNLFFFFQIHWTIKHRSLLNIIIYRWNLLKFAETCCSSSVRFCPPSPLRPSSLTHNKKFKNSLKKTVLRGKIKNLYMRKQNLFSSMKVFWNIFWIVRLKKSR